MKHLEYKDTNNKAFKTYYDKFKKMVKSDLEGDGWFLLVNDFPFKDGDNLMFTAGEDIGKWKGKNLVSLYGKTNYIIGRCRKKGPVLSLLHFQEGDYIKQATESGLRNQLKEYFKGTGVSTRIFKSVKVSDPDPDVSDTELDEETLPVEGQATTEVSFEEIAVPEAKPSSVKEAIDKLFQTAENLGVREEQEFNTLMTNFQKSVPSGPRMKGTIGKLNEYLSGVEPQKTTQDNGDLEEEENRLEEGALLAVEKFYDALDKGELINPVHLQQRIINLEVPLDFWRKMLTKNNRPTKRLQVMEDGLAQVKKDWEKIKSPLTDVYNASEALNNFKDHDNLEKAAKLFKNLETSHEKLNKISL